MPAGDHRHPTLIRIVQGVEGRVRMTAEVVFRFNYGNIAPWVRTVDDALVAVAGSDAPVLRNPIRLPLCQHPQRDSNPCCRLERAVS
jgi:hypothetical protein